MNKELNMVDEWKIFAVIILAVILLALIVDRQLNEKILNQTYATTRINK